MIVSSHKPNLMPWAGYWAKLAQSNVHIILGGVQFSRSDYINRVKVREQWLTIPINHQDLFGPIDRVHIANPQRVMKDAAKRIQRSYVGRQYPYAHRLSEIVLALEQSNHAYLYDLNMQLFTIIYGILGMNCVIYEDNIVPDPAKSVTENLVAHVRRYTYSLDDDITYITGTGILHYLNRLELDGLKVKIQQFPKKPPSDESILGIIAGCEHPRKTLEVMGCVWKPLKEFIV
jgi:hypothetical protein